MAVTDLAAGDDGCTLPGRETKPMARAKSRENVTICGVREKLKASSEKGK